jgi:hypothetical protein
MAHEASIRSFMFGEYAVRFKAAPISSGIAVNAFFKISSVIGFILFLHILFLNRTSGVKGRLNELPKGKAFRLVPIISRAPIFSMLTHF